MDNSLLRKSRMYFVAVCCPSPVQEDVTAWKHYMRDHFGCTVALKSPAHITLVPPFWFPGDKEEALLEALDNGPFPAGSFPVGLHGFSHFRQRVLFVAVTENTGLTKLKHSVDEYFQRRFPGQVQIDDRPFHPHITIANRDMSPGHFAKAWPYFEHKKYEGVFSVNAITLLRLDEGRWVALADRKL